MNPVPQQLTETENTVFIASTETKQSLEDNYEDVSMDPLQKKIMVLHVSIVTVFYVLIILLIIFLKKEKRDENQHYGEDLVVYLDSDCSKLLLTGWKTITVNEGLCNAITSELVISGYSELESFVVKKNSLINLNALIISDNPSLTSFEVRDGEADFEKEKNTWKIAFFQVKRVALASLITII